MMRDSGTYMQVSTVFLTRRVAECVARTGAAGVLHTAQWSTRAPRGGAVSCARCSYVSMRSRGHQAGRRFAVAFAVWFVLQGVRLRWCVDVVPPIEITK